MHRLPQFLDYLNGLLIYVVVVVIGVVVGGSGIDSEVEGGCAGIGIDGGSSSGGILL